MTRFRTGIFALLLGMLLSACGGSDGDIGAQDKATSKGYALSTVVWKRMPIGVCWDMANAMPKESVDLLNYAVNGEYDRARALYRALIDLFHLDTHVKLVQYIKLAENITAGYPEYVKAPRLMLEGEERQRTIAIVEKAIANVRALVQ